MSKSMFKEFKSFAMKGNVMDLAVGIIIGSAFGAIVSSLVVDIIMPPIGVLLGGVDFSNFAITLKEASDSAEAVSLNYGVFINTIINFLIVSFSVFLIVKLMSKLQKKEKETSTTPDKPSEEIILLREIRNLLKKK